MDFSAIQILADRRLCFCDTAARRVRLDMLVTFWIPNLEPVEQADEHCFIFNSCRVCHFLWQTNPARLVQSHLNRLAADEPFQHDLVRVAVGHRVNVRLHLRHLGRRQNPQAHAGLMLRPQDQRQLRACGFWPPLCRNLDAPLLIHAMPIARIVVSRLLLPVAHFYSQPFLKWLNHPQRPIFNHFTPPPVNCFFWYLLNSYSHSDFGMRTVLQTRTLLRSPRCEPPILISICLPT